MVGFPNHNSETKVCWWSLRENGRRLVTTVIRHITDTRGTASQLLIIFNCYLLWLVSWCVHNVYWCRSHFAGYEFVCQSWCLCDLPYLNACRSSRIWIKTSGWKQKCQCGIWQPSPCPPLLSLSFCLVSMQCHLSHLHCFTRLYFSLPPHNYKLQWWMYYFASCLRLYILQAGIWLQLTCSRHTAASIAAAEKHPLSYQTPQSVHMVRNCGAQTLPLTMHYRGKNWGKIGEGMVGFWLPTKGSLLLGFWSMV